jgi:DNA replication protein DnaC
VRGKDGENIVCLGPHGTGKTQLAVDLGLKAIQEGYHPLFTAALARSARAPPH